MCALLILPFLSAEGTRAAPDSDSVYRDSHHAAGLATIHLLVWVIWTS